MHRKYDPEKIVEYLRANGPKTPTELGVELFGIEKEKASGSICRILFDLQRAGKVERLWEPYCWVAK